MCIGKRNIALAINRDAMILAVLQKTKMHKFMDNSEMSEIRAILVEPRRRLDVSYLSRTVPNVTRGTSCHLSRLALYKDSDLLAMRPCVYNTGTLTGSTIVFFSTFFVSAHNQKEWWRKNRPAHLLTDTKKCSYNILVHVYSL